MRVELRGVVIDAGDKGIRPAWYPIRLQNARERLADAALATAFPRRTIFPAGQRNGAMAGLIETHRVEAYNTARQSENKMHDDTVARRFGFSGGLVPGVDVMAYMMHVPVAKWGRAFLERGLIEARFVKPVYDGEIAEVTAVDEAEGLTMEVQSKGELCATGTAWLPSSVPSFSIVDYPAT